MSYVVVTGVLSEGPDDIIGPFPAEELANDVFEELDEEEGLDVIGVFELKDYDAFLEELDAVEEDA